VYRVIHFRLTDAEVGRLLDQLDSNHSGHIAKSQFAASQMDWKVLQRSDTHRWMERAKKVFAALDEDGDGVLSAEEITRILRSKLPPSEVDGALRHVIAECRRKRKATTAAATTGKENVVDVQQEKSLHDGLNFRQFLRLLSPRSMDSLDNYEDRLGSPGVLSVDSRSSMNDVTVHDIDQLIDRSISSRTPEMSRHG
jgi:hypothetical protein